MQKKSDIFFHFQFLVEIPWCDILHKYLISNRYLTIINYMLAFILYLSTCIGNNMMIIHTVAKVDNVHDLSSLYILKLFQLKKIKWVQESHICFSKTLFKSLEQDRQNPLLLCCA